MKIDTSNESKVKLTAQKAGKTVVSVEWANVVVKYEIKIAKHALQKKTPSVSASWRANKKRSAWLDLEWREIKGAQGYCVYHKEGSKMVKVKTIKDAKKVSALINDTAHFADYYVRAYVKKNGVTIYSAYGHSDSMME